MGSQYGFLNRFGYWIGAILLASALSWLVAKVIVLSRQKTIQQKQIEDIEESLAIQKNHIAGILLINQSMINAQNEKELVDSVRGVNSGEPVLHPAIAMKIARLWAQRGTNAQQGSVEQLSPREL